MGFALRTAQNIQDEIWGREATFLRVEPNLPPSANTQHPSKPLISAFITQLTQAWSRPHQTKDLSSAHGKSSAHQPGPGEQRCNTQSAAQSPFSVWQHLYLWKMLIINPLRTPGWVSHLPGRECVRYLHKMTRSTAEGERRLKLTGSSLNCVLLICS